ncbi:hypothetical protein [Cypionkella sp.]|uniref:hypothetical protein n=1 Tax=Cypionkella sp. TaxID=2811411 RepID=UPI00260274EE|nr:hypothetical protein [Cypionkella sp.]
MAHVIDDFESLEWPQLEKKYADIHDARDWHLEGIKRNIAVHGKDNIRPIMYRPFDIGKPTTHRFREDS